MGVGGGVRKRRGSVCMHVCVCVGGGEECGAL